MKRFGIVLLLITKMVSAQQMTVRLYEGNAPGSENWTWKEEVNNKNSLKVMTVYNVVHPTLTVFSRTLPFPMEQRLLSAREVVFIS